VKAILLAKSISTQSELINGFLYFYYVFRLKYSPFETGQVGGDGDL